MTSPAVEDRANCLSKPGQGVFYPSDILLVGAEHNTSNEE
jgi:hypothetical protein